MKTLKDFLVIKSITVGPVEIEPRRIKMPYRVVSLNGETSEKELIYSYTEPVFERGSAKSINLASVVGAQTALNYGLFCRQVIFDGFYDEADKRLILDMMENTSREIYVNKILQQNEFLKDSFQNTRAAKQKRYTQANITFKNSRYQELKVSWEFAQPDKNQFAILSSGGKDSLLTYGLVQDLNGTPHPLFINESGRHWFTALNAYKQLEEVQPTTSRIWCNSDRIFNWMLRQMPFIRENFADIRSDIYPIRLWTMGVFLFGVLPIVQKRNIGNILIGNEYDTTLKLNYQGITHYSGLYDQSVYFDNTLSRYYLKKGWNIYQYSVLRSLSEILILKILSERYPALQSHQVSCHAAHEKDGRIFPCGNCEKCRRIVGMLTALEEDPGHCGYSPVAIDKALRNLEVKGVKQIGSDSAHLYYLLLEKGALKENEHTKRSARYHQSIMKLRFDNERSKLSDMPSYIREPLIKILIGYSQGATKLVNRKWEEYDVLGDIHHAEPYPFEIKNQPLEIMEHPTVNTEYLWENLTSKELEERLKIVDTVLLPCGSIEQHGPHLPVDIDYFDSYYLARKVAAACSDPKPLVLPAIPYGVSYHHDEFKGTLSVSNEGLSKFVYDIGISLAKNGIKKIIMINGHGDNAPTLSYAAQMINRDATIFVCVETGETSDIDVYKLSDTPNDIHAGEIETSTTLAIRPQVVRKDEAANETPVFGSSYLDFTSSRWVPWYVRTKKISETGIIGDPTKATAAKGKEMWHIMIAHLVKFVEEIKKSKLEDLYQKKY